MGVLLLPDLCRQAVFDRAELVRGFSEECDVARRWFFDLADVRSVAVRGELGCIPAVGTEIFVVGAGDPQLHRFGAGSERTESRS